MIPRSVCRRIPETDSTGKTSATIIASLDKIGSAGSGTCTFATAGGKPSVAVNLQRPGSLQDHGWREPAGLQHAEFAQARDGERDRQLGQLAGRERCAVELACGTRLQSGWRHHAELRGHPGCRHVYADRHGRHRIHGVVGFQR